MLNGGNCVFLENCEGVTARLLNEEILSVADVLYIPITISGTCSELLCIYQLVT